MERLSDTDITELIDLAKRADAWGRVGFVSFLGGEVHLLDRLFLATFHDFEVATRDCQTYPHELYVNRGGVKFFCITPSVPDPYRRCEPEQIRMADDE